MPRFASSSRRPDTSPIRSVRRIRRCTRMQIPPLVPGSLVFVKPDRPVSLRNNLAWWEYRPGANWRHPQGPGSSIARDDHPVVHIAHEDALAYAAWCGKELPTEAEWEFAARGGLRRQGLSMGRCCQSRGALSGQHLARPVSAREPRRGRIRRHFAGRCVSGQWLRPVRHGRQRLGMDVESYDALRRSSRRNPAAIRMPATTDPRAAW